VHQIVFHPEVAEQIDSLPNEALPGCAEVLGVLEVKPWAGGPQHEGNPEGAVRRWAFGPGQAGQVVYLILEDQRRVDVLMVQWLG
jgi:hypothetical protein